MGMRLMKVSRMPTHAAIAIVNARLHAEAAERARRLAVSAERERVVRDVHDTVARALGSILLHLDACEDPGSEHISAARKAARAALATALLRIRVAERRHREGPRHRG